MLASLVTSIGRTAADLTQMDTVLREGAPTPQDRLLHEGLATTLHRGLSLIGTSRGAGTAVERVLKRSLWTRELLSTTTDEAWHA